MVKKIIKITTSIILIILILMLLTRDWQNTLLFLKKKVVIYIIWLFLTGVVIYMTFLFFLGYQKIIYLLMPVYALLLIIVLFNRSRLNEKIISDIDYIIKWKNLIFTNRIVFINLIGNILLFIPLGAILSSFNKIGLIKKILLAIVTIIVLEALQYILRLGVFDIIDIICNMIGVVIGIVFLSIPLTEKLSQNKNIF